ncbi:MAG: type II toxin-antitoxin system RelE/ParE family toxin [Bifidobacteriaceae bacterium]|jgi:plasmid stabilization system protein ParE|nr:type II toxin-antitoxin system RelE/ParE family toxin [Bifidobacteriaceae bacterium]
MSGYRHREHPEAAAELDEAVRWYESQEPGIGLALVARAERARQDIADWPQAGPAFDGDRRDEIRSRAVRGYPYRIVYAIEADEIVILAYAHERRRPGYWLARLSH